MTGQDLASPPLERLDQIATDWLLIHDSAQFVHRYFSAMRSYFRALIANRADADDVLQDFMVRVVRHGFMRVSRDGGRFRDYLKTAVRNAALNHFRRQPAPGQVKPAHALDTLPDAADQQWLAFWRNALLERTWHALKRYQECTPESRPYTVLRLAVQDRDATSEILAARLSQATNHSVRADAWRKQLSRARRLFARFLIAEVTRTLDDQTPALVEEELCALGLMAHVKAFLPPDWPGRGPCP